VNVKEYISSGIVESYVLGLATEAERQEFETACQQYPEVREARLRFEEALEQKMLQEAVTPPLSVKEKIQASIKQLEDPADLTFSKAHTTPVRRLDVWKLLAAASAAALIGVLVWAINLNTRNQRLRNENAALQEQANGSMARLRAMEEDARRMQNPHVKMAAMQGTAHAPGAFATVYWDTASTDVYMMINNLPKPASDKQYQLWALINNQPVDLGVFEVKQQQLLVKMKNVQNAQAFAVTLEQRGGSPTPNMDAMYAMGKL
jgi:anti-sigma-K factor RskA